MARLRRILVIAVATLAVAGAGVFVFGKFYELSAIRQHPLWVYRGLSLVRDAVITASARDITVPQDFEAAATPEGAALYQTHCAQCHGAPGLPPEDFAFGMMPDPSNLPAAARERPPREVFWLVRNGLKMSGMPAWEYRLSDAEMWQITAMVAALPQLSSPAYVALLEQGEADFPGATDGAPAPFIHIPVPERGRRAMQVYGCRSCHEIPGVIGQTPLRVGPPLNEAAARRYIAGVLPNAPENMVRWIMDPQDVDPLSLMPDLDVPETVARDMAAYLYQVAAPDAPGEPPEPEEDPDGRAP